MRKPARILVAAATLIAVATPAMAGEITGNGEDIEMHAQSLCAFSGINDTPDGLVLPVGPGGALVVIDPGGQVQSYGFFKSHGGDFLPSPSDPAARDVFAFPGIGCNPVK